MGLSLGLNELLCLIYLKHSLAYRKHHIHVYYVKKKKITSINYYDFWVVLWVKKITQFYHRITFNKSSDSLG